jgi:hypothetical protein
VCGWQWATGCWGGSAALVCDGGSSYGRSPITAFVYWVDVQISFLNLLPAKRLFLIKTRTGFDRDLIRISVCLMWSHCC